MKRLVSALLIALIALVPALAFAESTTAETKYETYTNATNGYSIGYPAEWTILSKDTIQKMIDSIADGTMVIEGMDAATLKTYQAQIEATDMAMFLSKDGAVNVNVVYQAAPMKYDSNTIISAVYPAVLQQYQGMFSDYAPLADPQVETVGDLEFVETAGTYTLGGMKFIMLQAYYGSDSALYVITYTINSGMNPDMEALDAISDEMLKSFTLPATT